MQVLPVVGWVFSGCSGFFPQSNNKHVRLTGDWRPVQGVPRLSPEDCSDRLQPPRDPTYGLSGRKWMDGLTGDSKSAGISVYVSSAMNSKLA